MAAVTSAKNCLDKHFIHNDSGKTYKVVQYSSIKLGNKWYYDGLITYHDLEYPEVLYSRLLEDFIKKFTCLQPDNQGS